MLQPCQRAPQEKAASNQRNTVHALDQIGHLLRGREKEGAPTICLSGTSKTQPHANPMPRELRKAFLRRRSLNSRTHWPPCTCLWDQLVISSKTFQNPLGKHTILAPCALTNPHLHWKKSTNRAQQKAMETHSQAQQMLLATVTSTRITYNSSKSNKTPVPNLSSEISCNSSLLHLKGNTDTFVHLSTSMTSTSHN